MMSASLTETLAIEGGPPTRTVPAPSWPCVPEEGISAVTEVLRSGRINYWTGEQCRLFESEYARHLDADYALAVANGTVAIELALRALGVGPGDEVVVPSRTFIATAGAVVAVGASPVVADVDPLTNCITTDSIREVLSERTRAVIPVHLGGHPAEMGDIISLARERELFVVEDCAQAHGATCDGKAIGTFGDAGCFSFCQDKIIPLGEGGLVVFRDQDAYKRAWSYRDHGRNHDKTLAATSTGYSNQFCWLTDSFGSNYRLGEIEGALGRVMLANLGEYHSRRTENALRLTTALNEIDGITPLVPRDGLEHGYYRLYALVETERLAEGWTRDRVIASIEAEGVRVQYGSCALISEERAFDAYRELVRSPLKGARLAHEQSIAFFVHPTLSLQDMDDVASAVSKVMAKAL